MKFAKWTFVAWVWMSALLPAQEQPKELFWLANYFGNGDSLVGVRWNGQSSVGIRSIDEPLPPPVQIASLSVEDVALIQRALREAARIVVAPDTEGDRVVSVRPEQVEQQKLAAKLLREALALFGEVVK